MDKKEKISPNPESHERQRVENPREKICMTLEGEHKKEAVECKADGDLFFRNGYYEKAAKAYHKALEFKPGNSSDIHFRLSEIYANLGDEGLSEKHEKEAIRLLGKVTSW